MQDAFYSHAKSRNVHICIHGAKLLKHEHYETKKLFKDRISFCVHLWDHERNGQTGKSIMNAMVKLGNP